MYIGAKELNSKGVGYISKDEEGKDRKGLAKEDWGPPAVPSVRQAAP